MQIYIMCICVFICVQVQVYIQALYTYVYRLYTTYRPTCTSAIEQSFCVSMDSCFCECVFPCILMFPWIHVFTDSYFYLYIIQTRALCSSRNACSVHGRWTFQFVDAFLKEANVRYARCAFRVIVCTCIHQVCIYALWSCSWENVSTKLSEEKTGSQVIIST